MEQQITYTQEQVDLINKSHVDEEVRLIQLNINTKLQLLASRQKVQALTKELAEEKLKKTEDATK